jgi:ADP-heptose:LPS heptosyltransferase
VGLGDNLMASGLAKCAHARGKRIAFGDGTKIIWDHHSEQIFKGNPNIARPGDEKEHNDLEWVPFFRGNRIYNTQVSDGKWKWNYDFKAIPGEIYFSPDEHKFAERVGQGFIAIEPNVPEFKSVANNKRWPLDRYNKVARYLRKSGHKVIQFNYGLHRLDDVEQIKVPSFRHAARILQNAKLYIGPEGGLHHAAAAVGLPAVVLFGGFIPPAVTGYDFHINLTGGAEACGSLQTCQHCIEAMEAIGVDEVYTAAIERMRVAA